MMGTTWRVGKERRSAQTSRGYHIKKKKKKDQWDGEEWECTKKKERGGREAGSAGHKPKAFR